MPYIPRHLQEQVLRAAKGFPAVMLTGPRRAGKRLLLRRLCPKASYFLLEDPDMVARLRADPQGFLDAVPSKPWNMPLIRLAPNLPVIEPAAAWPLRRPSYFSLSGSLPLPA